MSNDVTEMRWARPDGSSAGPRTLKQIAEVICRWAVANGGEAMYGRLSKSEAGSEPRIAVRTVDDWVYAYPGDTIVMGGEYETERRLDCGCNEVTRRRAFTVRRSS